MDGDASKDWKLDPPVADPPVALDPGDQASVKYQVESVLKKYADYDLARAAFQSFHSSYLNADQTKLKGFWKHSQDVLRLLYFVLFPGTPVSTFMDVAVPILGVNAMGNQEIPPVQLIKAVGLRFCANPTPGTDWNDCCPAGSPLQVFANRYYRAQLLSIAYSVLSGADWVKPLWAPSCLSKKLTSVAAKGCVAEFSVGQTAQGNCLLQGGDECFAPKPHAWVSLACCSPAAYKILAPINLSELAWLAAPGSLTPLAVKAYVPTQENWEIMATNIIVTDLMNHLIGKYSSSTYPNPFPDLASLKSLAKAASALVESAAPAFKGLGFGFLMEL